MTTILRIAFGACMGMAITQLYLVLWNADTYWICLAPFDCVEDVVMILLLIFIILLIAVELPVTLLYRREEDVYVLTVAMFALMILIAVNVL